MQEGEDSIMLRENSKWRRKYYWMEGEKRREILNVGWDLENEWGEERERE